MPPRTPCSDGVPSAPAVAFGPSRPLQLTGSGTPPIKRKLLSQYEPAELNRLTTAYRKWMALGPRVLRNQKTHQFLHRYAGETLHAHDNWSFLLWHRAFIYFHERILSALLADGQSFSLPVWDWETSVEVLSAPALYDELIGCQHNSWHYPASYFSPESLSNWLRPQRGTTFFGTAMNLAPGSFFQYHLDIHSSLGPPMDVLDTAGWDPIFYAHHANVDRYFEAWKVLYPNEWTLAKNGILALDPPMSFQFVDGDGSWTKITASQLLSTEDLGYTYDLPNLSPARVVTQFTLDGVRSFLRHGRLKETEKLSITYNPKSRDLKPGIYFLAIKTGGKILEIGQFGQLAGHADGHAGPHPMNMSMTMSIRATFLIPIALITRLLDEGELVVGLAPVTEKGPLWKVAAEELDFEIVEFGVTKR